MKLMFLQYFSRISLMLIRSSDFKVLPLNKLNENDLDTFEGAGDGGDEMLEKIKENLRSEIDVFEKLQTKIVNIEEQIRENADNPEIDDTKLLEIDKLLADIDHNVLQPLGDKLVGYEAQISRSNDGSDTRADLRTSEQGSGSLQVIENFVSKAENVLQSEVGQIDSLQNEVNSLNVEQEAELLEFDSEVDAEEVEETLNYATYKSSEMIKNHIKQHNNQKEQSKDDSLSTLFAEKITTFQTIIKPYIIPAIPIFLIILLIIVFIIWRCCSSRKSKEVSSSSSSSSSPSVISPTSRPGTSISQVIAKDLGYTELKEIDMK